MKRCQSCGRLTELLEDFAGLDQDGIYCSSCADDLGKLKPFDEVVENLTQRIAKTDGFDIEASRKAALQILGRQPAWEPKFRKEEGMKTNKRRLALIAVAVVFALSAGGAAWWIANRFYENKVNPYDFQIANFESPFGNTQITKKEGFEINEFRCKGDQIALNIINGVLNIGSIDKEWILNNNEMHKLSNNQRNSNDINDLDFGSYELQLMRYNQMFLISQYQYDLNTSTHDLIIQDPPKVVLGDLEKSISEIMKGYDSNPSKPDVFGIDNAYIDNENVDGNGVFYKYNSKSVFCFPTQDNDPRIVSNLYIADGDKILFKMPLDGISITLLGKTYEYIIFQYNVGVGQTRKTFFMILNIGEMRYELLQAEGCKFQCMSDVDKFVYTDKIRNLIEYNFISKKSITLTNVAKDFIIKRVINNKDNRFLFMKTNGLNTPVDDKYYVMELNTKVISKLDVSNCANVIGIVGNNLVWSVQDENVPTPPNVIGTMTITFNDYSTSNGLGRIFFTNLLTGKSTQIDENVFIEYCVVNGFYIAWTKYAGPKDDQWKNVCWTKIP